MQRHFIGGVNLRRHIHADTHIRIVELRGYQGRRRIGLETAGGVWNPAPDLQGHLLSIGGANLWVVQYLGTGIGQHGLQ